MQLFWSDSNKNSVALSHLRTMANNNTTIIDEEVTYIYIYIYNDNDKQTFQWLILKLYHPHAYVNVHM